jgi:hypothetical protein
MRQQHKLKFRVLGGAFVVVRLASDASLPAWAITGELTSITRTADELSIVCRAENVPREVECRDRWSCLKLNGPFPFSLTGVLLSFLEPLSSNGVPIFAISTYDTDYVLIKEEFVAQALAFLRQAGHELIG